MRLWWLCFCSWPVILTACGGCHPEASQVVVVEAWRSDPEHRRIVWARWRSHSVRARQLAALETADSSGVPARVSRLVGEQRDRFRRRYQLTHDDVNALRDEAAAKGWERSRLCQVDPRAVHRTGSLGMPPVPLSRLEGRYSRAACAARLQGVVILQLVVGPRGEVHEAKALKELPAGLTEDAIRVAKRSRCLPWLRCGKPASAAYTVTVNYQLPPSCST